MAAKQNDPIRVMLEKRNPEWEVNNAEWGFLRQALEGGHTYVAGNLYRHELEDPKIFAGRQMRAADHHYNLTRLVIDSYEGYLFQVPPTLAPKSPACIEAYADKAGQDECSLSDFTKEVTRWLLAYGVIYIATDKPEAVRPEGRELSAQEEADQGLVPYSYVIHPQYMLDGKLEKGRFLWCIVQEDSRDDQDPESTGEPIVRYRVWEKDRIRVYRKDPKTSKKQSPAYLLESEIKNELGYIPIVPVYYGETSKDFSCPGLISDIAHIDRAIFNKGSLLDEVHYKVTFPQLVIPYGGNLFGDTGLSPEGQQIVTMGLDSFIPFQADTGEPKFLNYPEGPAKELREAIKEMVIHATALALLDGEAAQGTTRETASGVTKSYIFQKLNKRLATIADTLEDAFRNVFKDVQAWTGDDSELPDNPLDFPNQFEVKSLTQEITDYIAVLGIGISSPTFKAEVYKKVVRLSMPKLDDEALTAIDNEIEQMVQDEYQMETLQNDAKAAGHEADKTQAEAQVNGLDPVTLDQKATGANLTRELEKPE